MASTTKRREQTHSTGNAGLEDWRKPDWLLEFERKNGRPLRVLHIGNIANNSYVNAKIMRAVGIHADVCCHDYYHAMSTPEWEDASYRGELGDVLYPDWWRVRSRFKRPRWFFQGPVQEVHAALIAQFDPEKDERDAHRKMRLAAHYAALVNSNYATGNERGNVWRRLKRRFDFYRYLAVSVFEDPWTMTRVVFRVIPVFRVTSGLLRLLGLLVLVPLAALAAAVEWSANALSSIPERFGLRFQLLLLRLRWRLSEVVFNQIIAPLLPMVSRFYKRTTGATFSERYGKTLTEILADWKLRALLDAPLARVSALTRTGAAPAALSSAQRRTILRVGREFNRRAGAFSRWGRDHERWHKGINRDDLARDVALARQLSEDWEEVLGFYDIVQGCSIDGIRPMALGHRDYVSFEHGTLRSIPFEPTPTGRLTASAYRRGAKMIITNLDTIDKARKLRIPMERQVFLPAPVDDSKHRAFVKAHGGLRPKPGSRVEFFSSARQHWKDRDPNLAKGNDIFLRAFARVVRPEDDCRITLIEWGRDVEATKKLVRELGIEKYVNWTGQMNIDDLWRRVLACHCVVDQFIVPAFGRVTFDALIMGKRVITSLDRKKAQTFFEVAPPILVSNTQREAEQAVRRVLDDPDDKAGIGEASADWAARYHSSRQVLDLQLEAYRDIVTSRR